MNATVSPAIATTTWNIDPVHSTAQFKVKHMMISNVKGEFTSINGMLSLNEEDVSKSFVEVTIDATTKTVSGLPIHCKIIQLRCNAIQALLQSNSNNSSSCESVRYFAVAGFRGEWRRMAGFGGFCARLNPAKTRPTVQN